MTEACLEVEAVAACMAARPGQPQRCQLAGACSTRWGRCPGRPSGGSRSSAEPRRARRRPAVPLPCLEARLSVGHLTNAQGKVQDPRYAHKDANAGSAARQVMSSQHAPVSQQAGRRAQRATEAVPAAILLQVTSKRPCACQAEAHQAPEQRPHPVGRPRGSLVHGSPPGRSPAACPSPGAPG